MSTAKQTIDALKLSLTEKELLEFARLKARVAADTQRMSEIRDVVIALYSATGDEAFTRGSATAVVTVQERRDLSWKDVVISLKGEQYAKQKYADAPVKPIPCVDVKVNG